MAWPAGCRKGCWEAKDSKDDLDAKIAAKEAKGYPRTNIIYDDTRRVILIQDKQQVYPDCAQWVAWGKTPLAPERSDWE